MSTTFHPELRDEDLKGFKITCFSGEHPTRDFPDYPTAEQFYRDALTTGDVEVGCCGTEPVWDLPDGLEVNVSSSHAGTILDVLGFTDADGELPWAGGCDATDFHGRILIASALASDVGLPAHTARGAGGATMIDGGRREGYLADQFERLTTLAVWCAANGRAIHWE